MNSTTTSASRNTLTRFSPTNTQLNHGQSQFSTRLEHAPFYNKIDQCGTRKIPSNRNVNGRKLHIAPSTTTSSIITMIDCKSSSSDNLAFGELNMPSSTGTDPLSPANGTSLERMYERVNHPIGYSMNDSRKRREDAKAWDDLIEDEPTIARHSSMKMSRRRRGELGDSLSVSTSSRPARRMEEYAWDGPVDNKLDTELWRIPLQRQQKEKGQGEGEGEGQGQRQRQGDSENPLENSFTKCFAQSNMMVMEEMEERTERRRKHLESRWKVTEAEEMVREPSPEKIKSTIITHNVAAGEDHRKAMNDGNGEQILSIGPDGNLLASFSRKQSSSGENRLLQRRDCDKNTGTFRDKVWGAGGGGKSEPIGDRMSPGSVSASAEAPDWMIKNRLDRAPETLIYQKDRMKQWQLREYPLKHVSFSGIGGVTLTSRSVSNDLPNWMVDHRDVEYPTTVIRRPEKEWSPYNQPNSFFLQKKQQEQARKGSTKRPTKKVTNTTTSGDLPLFMTDQNKRIDPTSIRDAPANFSGLPGEKTFVNRMAPPSFRAIPKQYVSEVRAKRLPKDNLPIKSPMSIRVDGRTDLM